LLLDSSMEETAMRKRLMRAWNIVRHLLSIRSLLDVLGWRSYVMTSLLSIGGLVYAWFLHISIPFRCLVILAIEVSICFGVLFVKAYHLAALDRESDNMDDLKKIKLGQMDIKDSEFTAEIKDADKASGMDLTGQAASLQNVKSTLKITGHVKDGAAFRASGITAGLTTCSSCKRLIPYALTGGATKAMIKCPYCGHEEN
jgi:hypothetical protein